MGTSFKHFANFNRRTGDNAFDFTNSPSVLVNGEVISDQEYRDMFNPEKIAAADSRRIAGDSLGLGSGALVGGGLGLAARSRIIDKELQKLSDPNDRFNRDKAFKLRRAMSLKNPIDRDMALEQINRETEDRENKVKMWANIKGNSAATAYTGIGAAGGYGARKFLQYAGTIDY